MANEAAKTAEPSGGMTANQLLFGFSGRVERLQVWLVAVASAAIFGLFWARVNLRAPADPTAVPPPRPPGAEILDALPVVIGIGLIWPLAAIGVKRCHDRGRSGWWMLAALVPVLGWAWLVYDLAIARGSPAPNRFGPAPSALTGGDEGQATRDVRSTTVMFFLGFAAGLPTLLIFDTLSIWLRDVGLSLQVIGFFTLATLFTALKFLWAPIVDRTAIPGLTRWLGHRRSWMLVSQAVIILGLALISGTDPLRNLGLLAAFAVMVGFASANQDIVIDAWRIEVAEDAKQGAMAAAYQWGYRIAIIVAGAVPLILAEIFTWSLSYAAMAGVMAVGVLAALAAPREAQHRVRPIDTRGLAPRPAQEVAESLLRGLLLLLGALLLGTGLTGDPGGAGALLKMLGATGGADTLTGLFESDAKVWLQLGGVLGGFGAIALAAWPIPGHPTRPGVFLSSALGQPVVEFFGRYGKLAGVILALICLYRVSDFVLNINGAFYVDLGFTKLEIAEVRKVFGAVMSILGVTLGGLSVLRFGLMRSLIIGAFLGSFSNLAFAWLAMEGHSIYALMFAIAADNIGGGFAGTALIAYMSSLTSIGFTATQYALFSSLYALLGKLIASQSGRIVEAAAKAADGTGALAGLKGLMSRLPPESYAQALEKSGVSPAALGTGYLVFYVYTTVIGLAGMVLVFFVAARQPAADQQAGEDGQGKED
jgi:PAT family beta-lactamase induction signal transducer AmpG